MGLSWDRILKAAWEAFSPEIDTVLWLYNTIAGLGHMGIHRNVITPASATSSCWARC